MKIFISYRRAEDEKTYIVGTIHKYLADIFGSENVFRDTYDIHGGDSWRSVLENKVSECTVMLVIIGPDWASLAYPNGKKRLFDSKDVTRWEIETGLKRVEKGKTTVIPVLVMSAGLPMAEDLPESLRPLLDRNAIRIRNHPDFNNDIDILIRDIRLSQGYQEDDIATEYFEPETIRVEKGMFWMGSLEGEGIPSHETPQHEVFLQTYRIGKYPVTNKQYEEFVRQTGIPVSPSLGWDGQKFRKGEERYPVTGVTWSEALGYCNWLSKVTGRTYTLPNEAQWEKACRGGQKSLYPWGDELDPTRSNHGQGFIVAVDKYPEQNNYGCCDLVGNIRQWTCTLWGDRRNEPDSIYAYPWVDDGRNDLKADRQLLRVVRGCSVKDDIHLMRCGSRNGLDVEDRGPRGARYGFRIVLIKSA